MWDTQRILGNGASARCCLLHALLTTKQVQMSIEAHFVSDMLRGNDTTEMRVTLLRFIDDEMPPDDE